MRAIVISLKGKDGRHAKVIFDRYGMNADLFGEGFDNDQLHNHATSRALAAVIADERYGPGWVDDYEVTDVS
jgi:hypothetical protein